MVVNGSEQRIIQILSQGFYREIELNRLAFEIVGTDYAGPLYYKSKRS